MTCLVGGLLILGLLAILVIIALPNGHRLHMLQWSVRGCLIVLVGLIVLGCITASIFLLLRA